MAIHLNSVELKIINDSFRALDTDNDGKIAAHEAPNVANKLDFKYTEVDGKALIADADKAHTGTITVDDLVAALSKNPRKVKQARLRRSFHAADLDHSGDISAGELKKLFEQFGDAPDLTPEQINEFIQAADKNKDGKICFEEFVAIWDTA